MDVSCVAHQVGLDLLLGSVDGEDDGDKGEKYRSTFLGGKGKRRRGEWEMENVRLKAFFLLMVSSAIVVIFPRVASLLAGEGIAPLEFGGGVEFDGTRGSLVESDDGASDRCTCNGGGVGCEHGRVVSSFCRGAINRRLLQVTPLPRSTRVAASPLESFAAPGSSESPIPSPVGDVDSGKKGIGAVVFWTIGLISAAVVVLLVYMVFIRAKALATVTPCTTGLSGQLRRNLKTGASSLKRPELETACEYFSNIIGSLSDGKLFKGTLSSGVEIAAASFATRKSGWSKHDDVQFMKKVELLSKVDHKNFINILGYCKENKPFIRAMAFEYAPNGTLFDHLHVRDSQDLSWAARMRIAMGVAYCLGHLDRMKPPITLKNLNSNSIHLTDDLAAKVADLELWSGTVECQDGSGTASSLSTTPDQGGSIVVKFGILLLELVSGKLLYSDEDGGLVNWASDYLKGLKPPGHMVDPSLNSFAEQEVVNVIGVVKACLEPDPSKRLSMNDVVNRLRDITSITPKVASPRLSPLLWAELEIMSES